LEKSEFSSIDVNKLISFPSLFHFHKCQNEIEINKKFLTFIAKISFSLFLVYKMKKAGNVKSCVADIITPKAKLAAAAKKKKTSPKNKPRVASSKTTKKKPSGSRIKRQVKTPKKKQSKSKKKRQVESALIYFDTKIKCQQGCLISILIK